jgi:signal transduction histidine kinase
MRRLYLQIYLTFVGIVLLLGLVMGVAWHFGPASGREQQTLEGAAGLVQELLPAPDRPATELQSALERLRGRVSVSLAVRAPDGTLLAAAGEPLPPPARGRTRSHWTRLGPRGPAIALRLPDGRWLMAGHHTRPHGPGWLWPLALLAGAIAAGAYPVARRITVRLERLQARVDALGAGDLSSRVAIEGRDEVASLARSFNRAAERIERLVEAQRHALAGASHELRTPLARIRVAVELLAADHRPELRQRIARDIADLDDLIDELLVASRLEMAEGKAAAEEVDLLGLLAEEAARAGAEASGRPARLRGDARLLRRLVRNLLENARRHAAGSPVEAEVEPGPTGAVLRVRDRGPGVPPSERERIFEPFYRPPGPRAEEDRGVGLGLALVRRIARRHGGEARFLPREGGGSCFEVTLESLHEGPPAPPPPPAAPAREGGALT